MTQERDPIERIKKLVLSHDLATEKELKDMEKEIRKEVDDAIAKAKVKQQLHSYFLSIKLETLIRKSLYCFRIAQCQSLLSFLPMCM